MSALSETTVDNEVIFSIEGMDTTTSVAGIETVVEDLDALKYDVGELKDLLNNNKGEINHVRRIVLACERDMEDFTAAMDAVNVDLDEMRARVDATHSIITSRQRVEATMTAEISTMRLDIGDIQEALKNHDSWMEDVSNTLQQMQEKEENLTEDLINLKNEMNAKLDTKVDNFFFGRRRLKMNSEKTKTVWPKSMQTKTRILVNIFLKNKLNGKV